jgi:HD-GYP domain-containing protein (c-di-GMP phosphodiesterase class II)
VSVIRSGTGTQFCPNVVRHFRAVVMPYPVGHEIALPDGRVGVVASVDPSDPDTPTVRVKGDDGTIDELVVPMTPVPEPVGA